MVCRGSYHPLHASRRWMCQLVQLSRRLPISALQHRLCLLPLVQARAEMTSLQPSWVALFLKAFALLSRQRPFLRQAYFDIPWPRLYQHPNSVAAITIEREWQGRPAIFFEMLERPEEMPLMEIHHHLRRLKVEPVENFPAFRRLIFGSGLPAPLPWFVWRWYYSLSGPRRARSLGTFAINAGTRLPIRPVSTIGPIGTTLYFGPFDGHGCTEVCLTFDHRVLDGGDVVRTLEQLESVLNTDLLLEVQALRASELETSLI